MTGMIWILAADGNQARLLKGVNLLKDGQQNPEQEVFRSEVRKAQDLTSDKPGRGHSSPGHGGSAMEYSSDPVREEQMKFTAEIAGRIDHHAANGAFQRLVLCAAPQTLGDLRSKLSERSRTLTYAEIDKNFSNLPTDKLISSVRAIVFDA